MPAEAGVSSVDAAERKLGRCRGAQRRSMPGSATSVDAGERNVGRCRRAQGRSMRGAGREAGPAVRKVGQARREPRASSSGSKCPWASSMGTIPSRSISWRLLVAMTTVMRGSSRKPSRRS
jgi:hypothetical protein